MSILRFLLLTLLMTNCSYISDLIYERKEEYYKPPPESYKQVEIPENIITRTKDVITRATGVELSEIKLVEEILNTDSLDHHLWKDEDKYLALSSYCSLSLLGVSLSTIDKLVKANIDISSIIETKQLDIPYEHLAYTLQGHYGGHSGIFHVTIIKKQTCGFLTVFLLPTLEHYEEEKDTITEFIHNLDL